MFRSPMAIVILVVSLWFIVAFLIMPNVSLLSSVFTSEGSFSTRAWDKLMTSERAKRSLLNSVMLACILSVTINVVGIFIVLATRYFKVRGARLLWLGYATTLIYGGIVLVAGYNFLYGSSGMLTRGLTTLFPSLDPNWFTGMFAVCFVMTFAGTGNHLLFLSAALSKVDYQTIEAAKQLGASPLKILSQIVLPTLKPTIFALTVLTFLGGLGALAAPQIVGGREFQTIAPMILTFSQSSTSQDLAAALAIILAIMTMILLFVLNRLEAGGTYFSVSKVPVAIQKQTIDNPVLNLVVHVIAYVLFLIYALPPVLIVLFSFTDANAIASGHIQASSFTLDNYRAVLTDRNAYWPFIVSVGYSAAAAAIVIFGILFVARLITQYRNVWTAALEYLLHIPWIMPGTMLALGLILTFDHPNWLVGGRVLTGTLSILGIAYVAGKIPFTLRMLKAAFTGLDSRLEEAAAMLGASQFYTFRRVILPLIIPTATAITALNFNSMLDDYDTAVFLAHPFYQPLGIFIKNATEGEGNTDTTALTFVYTVVLMIITGITMYLIYGRAEKADAPSVRGGKPRWLRVFGRLPGKPAGSGALANASEAAATSEQGAPRIAQLGGRQEWEAGTRQGENK